MNRVVLDLFTRRRLWRAVQRVGLAVACREFRVCIRTLDRLVCGYYPIRQETVDRVRGEITRVMSLPPGRAFKTAERLAVAAVPNLTLVKK